MRVVAVVAGLALCACASATRWETIPSDKCGASVVADGEDRPFVFTLSEDSYVWYKYQAMNGKIWSPWRELADRRRMMSGPKAVRFADGSIQVFALGMDKKYYQSFVVVDTDNVTKTTTHSWTNWTAISNLTFSTPPVPLIVPSGVMYLFGVNNNTRSVMWTLSSSIALGDLTFNEFADMGVEATSAPSAMLDAEGYAHVFVRGMNRAIWHAQEKCEDPDLVDKTWAKWENLGGVMASNPSLPSSVNGVNFVEVYGRAADKSIWYRKQGAVQLEYGSSTYDWGEWNSLGGVLAGAPAVHLNDAGMVEVFVRGVDRAIYVKSQSAQPTGMYMFGDWVSLGGMFSTSPTVITRGDGTYSVFARGVDKAIWYASQWMPNGTAPMTWRSLGGHTRKFTC